MIDAAPAALNTDVGTHTFEFRIAMANAPIDVLIGVGQMFFLSPGAT